MDARLARSINFEPLIVLLRYQPDSLFDTVKMVITVVMGCLEGIMKKISAFSNRVGTL